MTSEPAGHVQHVEDERYCVSCSYDIRGLPVRGACPECGTPVERSLKGDLLEYSSPEYVGKLERGVTIVFFASIAQLAVIIVIIVLGISLAVARGGTGISVFETLATWGLAALGFVVIYGWWLFSTPDPAILTENTGANARKVLRVCAIVSGAASAAAAVIQQMVYVSQGSEQAIELMKGLADLLAMIASIVLFFASLLYIRWLAHRIPDAAIDLQAKRYIWLLPLIYVLGACLLGLGIVVATIMFLVFLNRVRAALIRIEAQQTPILIPIAESSTP